MTPSGPVNYLSNRRQSSANTIDELFTHQCHGPLSRFGVGCTAATNTPDLRVFLRFAPGQECTSYSCLELNAQNCGWEVRLKSIGLACVFKCAIVLRILLLTLLMLRLFASKLSSVCSRFIQRFFLTFSIIPQVIRWLVLHIHTYSFITPLHPLCHGLIVLVLLL